LPFSLHAKDIGLAIHNAINKEETKFKNRGAVVAANGFRLN
jgi:hypothetical protein